MLSLPGVCLTSPGIIVDSATVAPAPVAASPVPIQNGNGRGKHLFVTLNGQRHDVVVETLEG
jgi:hypothetical protein